MVIITFGGGGEHGLIVLKNKDPTKCFPGHKAPSKMSSGILYVGGHHGSCSQDSAWVPRAFFFLSFLDKAFIARDQG